MLERNRKVSQVVASVHKVMRYNFELNEDEGIFLFESKVQL